MSIPKKRPLAVESLDEYLYLTKIGGPLLALAAACRMIDISRQRAYRLASEGKIDVVMVKGQLHVRAEEMQRWATR